MHKTNSRENSIISTTKVSFCRRSAALCYDCLIVISVVMLATFIFIYTIKQDSITGSFWFQLYLLLVIYIFLLPFWLRGQTLGMLAWKIKLVKIQQVNPKTGANITKLDNKDCLLRYLFALLTILPGGIGLFWALLDLDNLTLYDRLSGTRLIKTG